MKKILLPLIVILLLFSCQRKKPEFIQLKVTSNLFLIKNIPVNDSLVKNLVKDFLLKNPPQNLKSLPDIDFYIYSSNTKYFLNHKEDDPSGLSLGEEQLSFYDNEKIAVFSISKCENDSTKLVGKLRFCNNYGSFYKPDTIIYKCK